MRVTYLIEQRHLKGWKAIFYITNGIMMVDSHLLSAFTPIPKKEKFINHSAFREALYKALFQHLTGLHVAIANALDIQVIIGLANLKLPPNNLILMAQKSDTKEGPEFSATVKVAHRAGNIFIQAAVGAKVKH